MHCCGVPVVFRHATWSAKSMCCCHGPQDWNDSNEVCRRSKNTEKGLRNLICITSFSHRVEFTRCVAEPLTLGADLRELSPHFHTAEHCQHWPIGSNLDGFKNGWMEWPQTMASHKKESVISFLTLSIFDVMIMDRDYRWYDSFYTYWTKSSSTSVLRGPI